MATPSTAIHAGTRERVSIRPIRSLLIANRGEIVVRIARTARAMGIGTIAVHSDSDANAVHVESCDEAIALGGDAPTETYLNMPKLLAAAASTGAEAVHPGYGFLSENAAFAQAVIDAGLVWVGPRPETIATMGDKVAAKRMMAAAGVPVLDDVLVTDETDVRAAAAGMTPPIIVKAAAGGGGKGMRIVHDLDDLPAAVEACRREAAGAFGDDRVFLERFLGRPRHVEVQIAGDRHGNVVHMFERECSIQRRHQKVLEESPSLGITAETRERLLAAAVAAGQTLGYESLGTVEFVVGGDGEAAFLEVNTRLQVEHPVTEAVTGIDLVRLQLLVAEGRAMDISQAALRQRGHAIEARLYAEDPVRGYLPAAGPIVSFVPGAADSVRWDSGIRSGGFVSPHYDPMLAKVIAWGETRDEAARTLERALRLTHFHGPATNRDLLCAVLSHPEFLAGEMTTSFLDDHFSREDDRAPAAGAELLEHAVIAAGLTAERRRTAARAIPSGWRNNPTFDQLVQYEAGEPIELRYRRERDGSWTARVGAQLKSVLRHEVGDGRISLSIDGHRMTAQISSAEDVSGVEWELTTPHGHVRLLELPRFADPAPPEVAGATRAPMHGQMVSVAVSAGDRVAKGQLLCIVEAMKMEQQLVAPYDAVVTSIEVVVGDRVETDQVLAVLEEEA